MEGRTMLNLETFDFCREFYFVEKSIELYAKLEAESEPRCIRIDALYNPNSPVQYSVKSYVEEDVVIRGEKRRVWGNYEIPWVAAESADKALARALSFLSERCERD
jgi:hypothetical protein